MFEYSQSTGTMMHILSENAETGDRTIFTFTPAGYSGNGDGLNNPAAQDQHSVGPIPQGVYTIGAPRADEKVGPMALRLTPAADNEMFGRGDFLIHGDNAHANRSASEGCIILPPDVRAAIGSAVLQGDDQLKVIE